MAKMLEAFEIPMGQAIQDVRDILQAGLVPMLRGSPGITKSAVIAEIAEELNLLMIDMRFAGFDPTDMNGFPGLDMEKGVARYYPLEGFPLEGDELPINPKTGQKYAGWLVFCDELTSAPEMVQAASYKFFLDRMVGQRKLHPLAQIAAAGNHDDDAAVTVPMSTALISRLINLSVAPDMAHWLKWAQAGNIRSLITSYLEWKPDAFYTFDAKNPDQPFACPRSWTFVNKLLDVWNGNPVGKLAPIAGCVNAIAHEFIAFAAMRKDLPKKSEVLANPSGAPVPGSHNPGPLFALSGAVGDWFTVDNADKMMVYIERMPAAFQIVTMRNITRRNGMAVLGQKDVSAWMKKNAADFVG
jgi:hypothetical protein